MLLHDIFRFTLYGLRVLHLRVGCAERTRRKPKLLFLFDGVLLFRLQTDALLALLYQEPPRLTRLEPDDEPSLAVFCRKIPF